MKDKSLFYTVKQACELLGVSHVSVYRLIHRGELPSYKIGGSRKIKKIDLEKWIEEQRQTVNK